MDNIEHNMLAMNRALPQTFADLHVSGYTPEKSRQVSLAGAQNFMLTLMYAFHINDTVTCTPIARQRVGTQGPAKTHSW
jgi:hypothetical protein